MQESAKLSIAVRLIPQILASQRKSKSSSHICSITFDQKLNRIRDSGLHLVVDALNIPCCSHFH